MIFCNVCATIRIGCRQMWGGASASVHFDVYQRRAVPAAYGSASEADHLGAIR
jgi:hypothetical protein